MPEPSWISKDLLRELTAQAQAAPRKRKNHNIHANDAAPCQRVLNAVEPESYIPPHCHLDPRKEETLLLLSGRVGVVFFDEHGAITSDAVLDANALRFGVTIPPGRFHTLVSLTSGTVLFETKAGPYAQLSADERASWAPAEGDPAATAYLAMLKRRFA
jgi:cupin fold WbuC family metalloprotein